MCAGLLTALVCSVVSAQPPLPEFVELAVLAEAVDGDAQQWSDAVRDTVELLKERAAGDEQEAIQGLFALIEVEKVRPVGLDQALPDEGRKQALRQALARAEARLCRDQVNGPPPPPPPPPAPRPAAANTALERLRAPTTPLSLVALMDLAAAGDHPKLLHQLVYSIRGEPYPEAEPLIEHVFATHAGGDTEAGLADALATGQLSYAHAEAAGLLYLLRPDNFSNVQETLIRCRQEWTGDRLTQVLPWLVAAYDDTWAAPRATQVLPEKLGVELAPGDVSLADRARVYRAWRDGAVGQPTPEAPALIDPRWDAENPVVVALQEAAEGFALESQRRLAFDANGPLAARKAAVRRLAFEGTDEDWQGLLGLAETEDDQQLLGHLLTLAAALAPERVPALQERMAARMGQAGGGVRTLALAIAEAKDKGTVLALASLAELVGKEELCTTLEDLARGQRRPPHWQSEGFEVIRNTIAAYGAIDLERARAFYLSLLQAPEEPVRRVGIYGVGELRVAEAVPELLTLVDPEYENCFLADCVIVALGKISTPETYEALIAMLEGETDNTRHAWEILVIMWAICGDEGRSPRGEWWNGCWATVAEDLPAIGPRFAAAMNSLADRSTDDRLAREARGRAGTCLRAAGQR